MIIKLFQEYINHILRLIPAYVFAALLQLELRMTIEYSTGTRQAYLVESIL